MPAINSLGVIPMPFARNANPPMLLAIAPCKSFHKGVNAWAARGHRIMSASISWLFAIVTLLLAACSNGNGDHSTEGAVAADQAKVELQSTSAGGPVSVGLSGANNVYGIANSGAPALDG